MSALDPPKPKRAQQATAVPFRYRDKTIEFCLVTSSAGRWIFPKGLIRDHDDYCETALNEAHEEAGLHGRILDKPLGSYEIAKNGDSYSVIAVLMEVSKTDKSWKEDSWRERRWATAEHARELLAEPVFHDLLDLAIRRIGESVDS